MFDDYHRTHVRRQGDFTMGEGLYGPLSRETLMTSPPIEGYLVVSKSISVHRLRVHMGER